MVQSVNQPTLCFSLILSISFILHMRRSCSNVNGMIHMFTCAFKKPHQFKLFEECLTSQMFAKVLIRFTFALYTPLLPQKITLLTNDFNLWIMGLNDLLKLTKLREMWQRESVCAEKCKTGQLKWKTTYTINFHSVRANVCACGMFD